MNTFLLSQCIAAASFALGISSFQFRKRKHVLYIWFLADALNALHFLLLDRLEVTTLLLLSSSRFLVAAHTTNRRWSYLFFTLTIVGFSLTYQHPVSLLVLCAGMLGTYGTFHPADISIRFMFLGCGTLWVIHNILVGSPVAIVMESSYLISNLVGLWRFYRHHPLKRWKSRMG